nr:hypothetical protein [Angustibacter aerolatus]
MTMIAARSSRCCSTLARRSSTSTSPASAVFTTTTFMPAITALAAFVPCALAGMRQIVRSPCPLARW